MGDSVATELIARSVRGASSYDLNVSEFMTYIELLPEWFKGFESVTFCNGGMHIEHANFRVSQILLRIRGLGKLFSNMMVIKKFTECCE
jgi:hypothetical protein